ncbi:MAG: excinuclease ABC subunit UvrC [Rickettsiales bacterium]|nr:excinuclease ABC subunit UvrC [Rickettsiales bacterium]
MSEAPKKGHLFIAEFQKTAPKSPGVYRMINENGEVLYVGKAKNLYNRIASYTRPESLTYRIQRMISHTVAMELILTETEAEALLLEANLIKKIKPRYNILLKDDKMFPYIRIDKTHEYPGIGKHRGKKEKDAIYYGPFASAGDVNQTIQTLQKIFLLRPCSDSIFSNRKRPCLEYQIKRCSAPCVGKISIKDYDELLSQAKDFLSGKSSKLQAELAQRMEEHSLKMEYEKAAIYRDRIAALTQIQSHQLINVQGLEQTDIIALNIQKDIACIQVFFFRYGQNYGNKSYFPKNTDEANEQEILTSFIGQFYQSNLPPKTIILSHKLDDPSPLEDALSSILGSKVVIQAPKTGNKAKIIAEASKNAAEAIERKLLESASKAQLFETLAERFNLMEAPERIEVYDNSHTFGQFPVGAMIVANQDGFVKNAYRRFTIKSNIQAGDDYGMMREVISRRFQRLLREQPERKPHIWPDLIIIDGGKGHLEAVQQTLLDMGITDQPILAISKGPARKVGNEFFHMPNHPSFQLDETSAIAHYMERIRDEAHRYAIGSHRNKRAKTMTKSALDEIEGIGGKRKKALLSHFGSVKAVQAASLVDIMNVNGINQSTAQKIYNFFHDGN